MKNKRRENFIRAFTFALGIIGCVASILALNSRILKFAFGVILILFVCGYIYIYISDRLRANLGEELISANSENINWDEHDFKFHYVDYEGEILRICDFEGMFLNNSDFPPRKVAAMWKRYKKSIIYCNNPKTGEIAAVFGLWPITSKALRDLVNGKLQERYIDKSDIMRSPDGKNWWIGFLGATPSFRKENPTIAGAIITWTLEEWLKTQEIDNEINIVAGAWTKPGEKHLKHLAFAQVGEDEDSPYLFKGKISDLVDRLAGVRVRFNNQNST